MEFRNIYIENEGVGLNKSNKTSGITWSIDYEIVEEVDSYTYLSLIFQKMDRLKNVLVN